MAAKIKVADALMDATAIATRHTTAAKPDALPEVEGTLGTERFDEAWTAGRDQVRRPHRTEAHRT